MRVVLRFFDYYMEIVVSCDVVRLISDATRNRWLSEWRRTSDVVVIDNDYHSQFVNYAPVYLP